MNTAFPFMLPGLLCPLFGFAFFLLVASLIVRAALRSSSGSSGPAPAPRPSALTELAEDGFWIVSCAANPDAVLHYHYWSNGVRYAGRIPFQPDQDGRQFVYTGLSPERATITRILDASDDDASSLVPPVIAADSTFMAEPANEPQDTPSSSSSTSIFPSAY